jgi:hypothetical protein
MKSFCTRAASSAQGEMCILLLPGSAVLKEQCDRVFWGDRQIKDFLVKRRADFQAI